MTRPARRRFPILFAALATLALAGAVLGLLLSPAPAQAQEGAITASGTDHEAEVRITAQRRADGRTEFALQQREADGGWSARRLPRARLFPARATVGRWLWSTPLTVRAPGAGDDAEGAEVRITAQRRADDRIEFALQERDADGEWGARRLPRARLFPATATVGRWLWSTPLTVKLPELLLDMAADVGSVASDRTALVALYNATGGASWNNNANWLSDRPLGEWHGVTTNSNGRVTDLALGDNQLTGPIPAWLGDLTNLTGLLLWGNQLTGPIPAELGDLTNLTHLYLASNQLTGPTPAWLGDLTNLTELYLASNELTGPIPAELGDLTNLTGLNLWGNQLTGPIPAELGDLTNLTHLYLASNELTGEIPPELGGLSNLTELSLRNNLLTGEIPPELGRLSNLTVLWLQVNQLTGEIPPELGGLTNLTHLYLASNQLTGCIPEGLRDIAENDLGQLNLPDCGAATPGSTATPTPTPLSIAVTGPQIYNDNVFVLPVEENLARGWFDSPLQEHTARFYEYFNDEFDFLVFVSNVTANQLEPGTPHGAYYVGVENDVMGIGETTYAHGREWGSTEKLQGVIYINTYDYSSGGDFVNGVFLHELMHRWANFVVPPSGHWGFISEECILDGYNISTIIDHGDGRYSHEFSPSLNVYCPIELYLAGLIPPEDVPDFRVAVDGEWVWDEEGSDIITDDKGYRVFTASGFETYTVDDIIAEHGPRVPDTSKAQKDFRVAVVLLVGTDYPATPAILDRLSYDVSWQSHPGDRDHMLRQGAGNFYHATGGRGTIIMDSLSEFLKDGE